MHLLVGQVLEVSDLPDIVTTPVSASGSTQSTNCVTMESDFDVDQEADTYTASFSTNASNLIVSIHFVFFLIYFS